MPDMLVKLYRLHNHFLFIEELQLSTKIIIRRTMFPERNQIGSWVQNEFGKQWGALCEMAFVNDPISCYLAIRDQSIIGFACYDVTFKGVFGPIGVNKLSRGLGIGKALLLSCLCSMRNIGYAYAVIGQVGPTEFYEKTVGALTIQDSDPGCFTAMLDME